MLKRRAHRMSLRVWKVKHHGEWLEEEDEAVIVRTEVEAVECGDEPMHRRQSCHNCIGLLIQDWPAKFCHIKATSEKRKRCTILVYVELVYIFIKDLCKNSRSDRIGRDCVTTYVLFVIGVSARDLMRYFLYTGSESVYFGLSSAVDVKINDCDVALRALMHMAVHAFHELVKRSHNVNEVGGPLLDPFKGTEKRLQLSPVCGRLHRQQAVPTARFAAGAIGWQNASAPIDGSSYESTIGGV